MKTNIKRVRMPATILNILYFMMLLIGALGLFAIHETNASPIVKYCERQYETFRFHPMTPRAEQRCDLLFKKWTYEWESGIYNK